MSKIQYIPGELESSKFEHLKKPYADGLEKIKSLNYTMEEYVHYFPAFCGHLTLVRYISLIECYQKTLGVAGHIAELGVYKGAGSLLFSKLIQIYEPNALTQVHGFDWFEGSKPTKEEKGHIPEGGYQESYNRLMNLIQAQKLEHICKIHIMDLTGRMIHDFFEQYPHLRFKLVFFDAGMYDIVVNALPLFWDRMEKGGIIIFDQYNFDIAPGETRAVKDVLPNEPVKTFPFGWMPTAYIIK